MTDLRTAAQTVAKRLREDINWTGHGTPVSTADEDTLELVQMLEAALEQQASIKPVAWANINKHGDIAHTNNSRMKWSTTPIYTHPPSAWRKPLTREEMLDGLNQLPSEDTCIWSFQCGVAFAERAHGIGVEK